MKKIFLNTLKFVLFFGIGIFFIWLSTRKLNSNDIQHILDTRHHVNYFWISAALTAGILSHVFRTLRWMQLLETLGKKPRFVNTLGAVFIGYFANLAIPRLGEASRCGILSEFEGIPFNKSLGTVITERLFDLLCFGVVMLLTLYIEFEKLYNLFNEYILKEISKKSHATSTLAVVIIIVGVALFGFICFLLAKRFLGVYFEKIMDFVKGLGEGLKSVFIIKKPFLFILYSIGIWIMYFFMAYLSIICIPETRNVGFAAGLAVLAFGSIGIMVSAGGIGAYPFFAQITLALYNVEKNSGLAAGWVSWTLQTLLIIILGIFFLVLLPISLNG